MSLFFGREIAGIGQSERGAGFRLLPFIQIDVFPYRLGGEVTSEGIDVAVEVIVHEEGLTAVTALVELNLPAQTEDGRGTLRVELARWIMHERDLSDEAAAQRAQPALTHLLQALGGELRQTGARPG